MARPIDRPISGHVYRHEGTRGPVWRAKYRLPDGRQVHRTIGRVWTQRARPPSGYFTKRTAEEWLRGILDQARHGTLPGMVKTGVTFSQAADEFLRYIEDDRGRKPNTVAGYRSIIDTHLRPVLGEVAIEDITPAIVERVKAHLSGAATTKRKVLVTLHGIMERARKLYRLPFNPAADVEVPAASQSGEIDVLSPEEVMALVRAAESEQDAAIYLTAAFTGLRRGELLALRWRDIDFTASTIRVRASYSGGALTSPKSGKVRAVPMAPNVAEALAKLGRRDELAGDDDLVFPGIAGTYLDASALRRRYVAALKRAHLRPIRFHDLRHTFGTRVIAEADIRRVQEWMGHADIQTTMRYLHYAPRADDAALVARAFAVAEANAVGRTTA